MNRLKVGILAMLALCTLTASAEAQLFKNLFGSRTKQVGASGGCPNGNCPTALAPMQSSALTVDANPGHWTYPGTIENHLESTHGVATAGLSRQQKLNLHDALHEGAVPAVVSVPRANYAPPAPVYNYGSAPSSGGGSTGGYAKKFSGGCTGSFAVGNRDSYGHVIVSIGEVTSEAEVTQATSKTFGALGSRRDFKKALLEAAKQAQDDGDISAGDYRKLAFALKIPGVAAKMESAMSEQAVENGVAKAGSINWDQLRYFIKEMIPIIMQLIQLFAENIPEINLEHPYVQRHSFEPPVATVTTNEWYSAA